jgi:hypothetical protein
MTSLISNRRRSRRWLNLGLFLQLFALSNIRGLLSLEISPYLVFVLVRIRGSRISYNLLVLFAFFPR